LRLKRLVIVTVALLVAGCSGNESASELVLYSGRSQSLVEPLINMFQEQTGINVKVKYGKSAQLALAIEEEGERTPADVFWSQDAGALGVLAKSGRFSALAEETIAQVPQRWRHSQSLWVATSGRARVFAYAPDRVDIDERPTSVFDLTDVAYRGRVGWAPLNASFQSFVTAMRRSVGEEATREWLVAMAANGTKAYPKNTAIIEGIAAGEVDMGLPNHYYLLRFKDKDAAYPVEQTFFVARDIGNLVNVAGVGVLQNAKHTREATLFVAFLLSDQVQSYFAETTFEYPVLSNGSANDKRLHELMEMSPEVPLNELDDLQTTLDMLREAGLL